MHTSHSSASPYLSTAFRKTLRPRHLRCLFQLALNACSNANLGQSEHEAIVSSDHPAPHETALNLAESVLDEAIALTLAGLSVPTKTHPQRSKRGQRAPLYFSSGQQVEIETEPASTTNVSAQTLPSRYPDEELEWLATMTFNRAVDFYLASMDEECRRWAGKAIELADLMQKDEGRLVGLLRNNFAKLI